MSEIAGDSVNIRRMSRRDIDDILVLVKKTSKGESRVSYKDLVANDPGGPFSLSFVAEAEHKIVGFVLARLEYIYIPLVEVCLIHALVVDPEYQRRRIGSALMDQLLYHCHLEDINTIRTFVTHGDNEWESFVEHSGFHRSTMVNWDKTFEV
jgi:ribosomal protein S18 acetylase RimI-like enzyme